jgi:hypothetical protein
MLLHSQPNLIAPSDFGETTGRRPSFCTQVISRMSACWHIASIGVWRRFLSATEALLSSGRAGDVAGMALFDPKRASLHCSKLTRAMAV